jgi:hypothetical protein
MKKHLILLLSMLVVTPAAFGMQPVNKGLLAKMQEKEQQETLASANTQALKRSHNWLEGYNNQKRGTISSFFSRIGNGAKVPFACIWNGLSKTKNIWSRFTSFLGRIFHRQQKPAEQLIGLGQGSEADVAIEISGTQSGSIPSYMKPTYSYDVEKYQFNREYTQD